MLFLSIFILSFLQLIITLNANNFQLIISSKEIVGKLIILILLYISYSIINMIINGCNIESFERLFQIMVCFSLLIYSSQHMWAENNLLLIYELIRIIVLLSLIFWPITGFITNYYQSIYSFGNVFGSVLFNFIAVYFLIPRKFNKKDYLYIFLMFFFLLMANSRSSIIAVVIFFIMRFIFAYFQKRNLRYKELFLIFMGLIVLVPFIYLYWFENSEIRILLEELSRKYLRKNMFSGRQILWSEIYLLILKKPWLGYGFDITPEDIIGGSYSAHNWYMQILLQSGIVGLFLLIVLFVIIWNILYSYRENVISRNTMAYLLAVMIWQCFEVSITQNNLSTGLMVWLILGIGISLSQNN